MCKPASPQTSIASPDFHKESMKLFKSANTPSTLARYTCLSIVVAVFAGWHKYTFTDEKLGCPSVDFPLHSYHVPLKMTVAYLASLPVLNAFTKKFLAPRYDMKALLFESMVFYNVAQVCMNVWMVWRFLDAVINRGHPFIGSVDALGTGTSFAIWVHYSNKYLEFLDTYFMVLRGRMDQVSFLHVYHHTTIAWAWWAGFYLFPGGDSYFGALCNSLIHVMMYSYYALALFKISCPWKRFLTQAQLIQFTSVVVYSAVCICMWGEKRGWPEVTCIAIQVFEMTSLFVLFARFYKKSYSKNKKGANANVEKSNEEDQCAKAMGVISSSAIEQARTAAKETNKLMKTANNIVGGGSGLSHKRL